MTPSKSRGGSAAGRPATGTDRSLLNSDHRGTLRIRSVRPLVVNTRMRNWTFVKVETDSRHS
jgi:hypothetical protein